MPDWELLLSPSAALQAVLWIVALALFAGVVVKLWPLVKNAVAVVDALLQLPAMKKQIDAIHHETHPNGGGSLRDTVDDLTRSVADLTTSVEGVHGRMDDVDRQLTTLARDDEALWAAIEDTQEPDSEEEL